jgi:rod shape-determining protein MreD
MEILTTTVALIVAVLLQWTLRNIFPPLAFIDFPLIIIVYVALQRDAIRALLYATIAGVAVDALSGGILGASGFSKTLTAFVVVELARRVLLVDNLLLRIPVLAGASFLEDTVYYAMNRLLGQVPSGSFVETMAYSLVATTITGTVLMLILENFFSERARIQRYAPAPRRQSSVRRNPIRLGRRV